MIRFPWAAPLLIALAGCGSFSAKNDGNATAPGESDPAGPPALTPDKVPETQELVLLPSIILTATAKPYFPSREVKHFLESQPVNVTGFREVLFYGVDRSVTTEVDWPRCKDGDGKEVKLESGASLEPRFGMQKELLLPGSATPRVYLNEITRVLVNGYWMALKASDNAGPSTSVPQPIGDGSDDRHPDIVQSTCKGRIVVRVVGVR